MAAQGGRSRYSMMNPMVIEEGGAIRLRTQCVVKRRKVILGVLGCLLSIAVIATLVGLFSGKDDGDGEKEESVTQVILKSGIQLKKTQSSVDDAIGDLMSLSTTYEDGTEAVKATSVAGHTESSEVLTTSIATAGGSSIPSAKIDVPKSDVPDSEASSSTSSNKHESNPTSTTTFRDPSTVVESGEAGEEILPPPSPGMDNTIRPSSTPRMDYTSSPGTGGNTTSTEEEPAWCSTNSGHPCAFPFNWGSYTWNRCVPSAFGPWCATYLRGDHSYSSWGRCDADNCKPGLM